MKHSKAKKIIENDEELNLETLAEAILEDKKHIKENHGDAKENQFKGLQKKLKRDQEEIEFRNQMRKVWKKKQ